MVEFPCTSCGQRLKVPDDSAGKAGKCPNCGTTLTIPLAQAPAAPAVQAAPQPMPRPAPPPAAGAPQPMSTARVAPAPAARPAARPASRREMILSIAALVVGAGALGFAWWRGPGVPGKGLGSYEFETPEGAVRSAMEIRAKTDIRAMMELQRAKAMLDAEEEQKKLDSWESGGKVEYDGKIGVMYKYKDKDGKTKRDVTWVEKKDDGLYYRTYTSAPPSSEAGKKIREWRGKDD